MDYDKMTPAEFDSVLLAIIDSKPASMLIFIPGIYEILSEHFNNEVLDAWAIKQT